MDNHLPFKEAGLNWLKANLCGDWVFFQCTHDEEKSDFSYSYLFQGCDEELASKLDEFNPICQKEEATLDVKQIFYRQRYTEYPIQVSMSRNRVWISLLSESAWQRLTRGTKAIRA